MLAQSTQPLNPVKESLWQLHSPLAANVSTKHTITEPNLRCCSGNKDTACERLYTFITRHTKIYAVWLNIFFFDRWPWYKRAKVLQCVHNQGLMDCAAFGQFRSPCRPLICDNRHLVGYYPLHIWEAQERGLEDMGFLWLDTCSM